VNDREVEQLVRMARAYAAEQLPWFASPLFAARLVVTGGVEFAATAVSYGRSNQCW